MKRKLLLICFFTLCSFYNLILVAQTTNEKRTVVKLGVWDPVGTNGKASKEYTNVFSFNLLYGRSASERAFTLSGLGSAIEKNAYGVQIAGLANVIGGNANGLTLAGLSNITENINGVSISGLANISQNIRGLQISGLTNISENVNGVQISGLGNISENVKGLHISGLGNISQRMSGLQISGLGNIAEGVSGVQFAGIGNLAEKVSGIQLSGIGNVAENLKGFQFSGIFNRALNVNGLQLAGIYNKAKNVKGLQFAGIFNKAESVKGVQFSGLINIAQNSDYPIGLINIIKNGEKSIGVTFDELQNLIVGFRSGGRVLYGILGVGYNFKSSENLMAFEGGFGANINCISNFRVKTELIGTIMTRFDDVASRSSLRILPAYKPNSKLEIFAGPTINYLSTDDEKADDLFPKHSLWKDYDSNGEMEQLYIGYMAGIQFVF